MNALCLDQVVGTICRPSKLDLVTRNAMLQLMQRYYKSVNETTFMTDLNSKDCVICLRSLPASESVGQESDDGKLVGFSTQKVLTHEVMGTQVRALFSGDTIVEREHWNSPRLARAWGRLAIKLIDETEQPLYWLLLSKGFRTYRFLPLFFRCYAPAVNRSTPPELDQVRRMFMQEMYADAFDPSTCLIRGSAIDNYSLRNGVADIDSARLDDPHIRFFLASNPGHRDGDELCCIAPLNRENFTAAARRVIGVEYF